MIYLINSTYKGTHKFKTASLQDAVDYCETQDVLSVDTETTGLDFTSDKVILFQIGTKEKQFLIDTRSEGIELLRPILESPTILKLFHNAKFDLNFIRSSFGIRCETVYDTMLMEKVLTCGKGESASLFNTLIRRLKIELDKTQQSSFVGHKGEFTTPQLIYAAKDVEHLIDVRYIQSKLITGNKLDNLADLENEVVISFADIEFNGLDLDQNAWLKLADNALTKAEAHMNTLDTHITTDKQFKKFVMSSIQGDLFPNSADLRKIDVKWTSPTQVLSVFQCLIPKLDNVNGKELFIHRFSNPIIDEYIRYKEQMKIYTSYGERFMQNLKGDGRVHTSFHQILDTGRVSSSKPNMQQIPADNAFRNCFIAPEGWKFVSADYSSQELNVIAFGSQDPVWLKALEEGQDLHSVCAELVYGDKWMKAADKNCNYLVAKGKCKCKQHKKLRTNVKSINFGLAYGMGANKLAATLDISKKAAEKLIEDYFEAFPAIKGFLERLSNFGTKFGYIKTFPPYNRKRWFNTWFPKMYNSRENSQEFASIERASKNTPIQGASADMTKKALILIRNYIKTHDIPVKVVMTVHDQIDTICEESYLKKWTIQFKLLMEEAAAEIVTNGLLKAEVSVSDCWEK